MFNLNGSFGFMAVWSKQIRFLKKEERYLITQKKQFNTHLFDQIIFFK